MLELLQRIMKVFSVFYVLLVARCLVLFRLLDVEVSLTFASSVFLHHLLFSSLLLVAAAAAQFPHRDQ